MHILHEKPDEEHGKNSESEREPNRCGINVESDSMKDLVAGVRDATEDELERRADNDRNDDGETNDGEGSRAVLDGGAHCDIATEHGGGAWNSLCWG